jgi:hypothetical protein
VDDISFGIGGGKNLRSLDEGKGKRTTFAISVAIDCEMKTRSSS